LTYRNRRRALARAASVGVLAAALVPVAASAAGSGSGSGGVGPTAPAPGAGDGAFPVIGKVTYGDGLGAGRGHQGQDLIGKCGKPVVAAQPGRVKYKDYDGGAGNYVVIDGKGELEDTVYMHLEQAADVSKREQVSAGQVIGRVGTTGRSSTCHLHFEMWDGAGWYDGGSPIDPKPFLKLWDRKRRG
jgi:murein DD-endopeptidase MepM/ murein hydrolase activator NlpD